MNIADLMKQGLQSLDEVKVDDWLCMWDKYRMRIVRVVFVNDVQVIVKHRPHELQQYVFYRFGQPYEARGAWVGTFLDVPKDCHIQRYQQQIMRDVKEGIDEVLWELEAMSESLAAYAKQLGGEL